MATPRQGLISPIARVAQSLVCLFALALLAATAPAQTRTVVHRIPVEYPALAKQMRICGTVTVVATVDTDGSVGSAKAIAGHAMLRPAAEKAVLQWRFASAPKPEEINIEIQFQLHDGSTR